MSIHLIYLQDLVDEEKWKTNVKLLEYIYIKYIAWKYGEEEEEEDDRYHNEAFGSEEFWECVMTQLCESDYKYD